MHPPHCVDRRPLENFYSLATFRKPKTHTRPKAPETKAHLSILQKLFL